MMSAPRMWIYLLKFRFPLFFGFIDQNGGNQECPDLDFVYCDTDTHPNEIAEMYSYTEQNEFQLNVKVKMWWCWL